LVVLAVPETYSRRFRRDSHRNYSPNSTTSICCGFIVQWHRPANE